MYKLVKNELYKLFHKKSTLILLIVLVVFVILTNVIYKNMNNFSNITYSDEHYISQLKNEIDNFDKVNGNMLDYASLLSSLEIQEYVEGKENDWRVNKYYSLISQEIHTYYELLYYQKKADEAAVLRTKIDEKIEKLNNNDWRYFVNIELKEINDYLTYMKYSVDTVGDITANNRDYKEHEYRKYLLEYRLENNVSYEDSYLNTAINTLESTISEKISYELANTDEQRESFKSSFSTFMENEYILENKLDTNNIQSLGALIRNFYREYLFLIIIFVIMIAGGIVSDEFNKGTVKSLLTLPYTRNQILLSKFLTSVLMIPFVILFLLLVQTIIGGVLFGFGSLSIPVVAYNFKIGAIEVMNLAKYFSLNFIGFLPMILLLSTLAFSLSTLLCSTAFAITVTFCGYFGAAIINEFAMIYKIKFLNYFVTTNWDLTSFIFGGKSVYDIPIAQSVITCLIYFIIIFVITFIVFKKKNIKNI